MSVEKEMQPTTEELAKMYEAYFHLMAHATLQVGLFNLSPEQLSDITIATNSLVQYESQNKGGVSC